MARSAEMKERAVGEICWRELLERAVGIRLLGMADWHTTRSVGLGTVRSALGNQPRHLVNGVEMESASTPFRILTAQADLEQLVLLAVEIQPALSPGQSFADWPPVPLGSSAACA